MPNPRGTDSWTRRGVLSGVLCGVLCGALAAAALRIGSAGAQAELPAFEVTGRDIAKIADKGGRLHIALNDSARTRFAEFTANNMGRTARVTAGGVVLIEAVVRAEIDSGLLSSAPLDDHTRGRIFRLLIGS